MGQGDAILVGFPDGETMLVDGGGIPGSAFDIGQRVLVPELERRGIRRLGRVVLTHAHEDHGGGLREVLRELSVGELLTPDAPEEPLREALEELARAQGARAIRIRRGYTIQEGETTVECLSPLQAPVDDPNSDSIVLRITHGGRCALLMGDAGAGVEAGLLASGMGRCDFLKVGHHGSDTSTSGPLLAATAPRVAGISVGSAARFGHPAPAVLERLREGRALVLSTFASGALRFSTCAGHLHAGALLPSAAEPWPGPPLRPRPLKGPRCCQSERE